MRRAVVLLVLLAACSSGGSASSEPTEDALRESVEQVDDAMHGDVADSYDLLSERCQDEWKRGDWAANVAGGLMMAQAFGMDFDDTTLDEIELVDFVEGESATVITHFVDKDGEPWSDDPGDGVPWVFEDGWRMDDCESMEG
jgi:hypothetical protein